MRRIAAWLAAVGRNLYRSRRSLAFTVAFAAVAGGCYLERPSLALIVPGALVLVLLIVSQIMGWSSDA